MWSAWSPVLVLLALITAVAPDFPDFPSSGSQLDSCGDDPLAGTEMLYGAGATIAAAEGLLDDVWPGYWFPGKKFILAIPGQCVLLYSSEPAPPGYEPLSLVSAGTGSFYLARGNVPRLGASEGHFDIRFPVGRGFATAVPIRESLLPTLHALYHEAFHAYQNDEFSDPSVTHSSVPNAVVGDPEFRALAEVERRVLAEAIVQSDEEALRNLARRYLAVRLHRLAAVPAHVADVEREMERVEGTAQFVGYSAAVRALDLSATATADIIGRDLRKPAKTSRFGGEWTLRLRVYATGAAIGVLLERLATDWRSGVERGASLEALLVRSVASDGAPASLLPSTLDEFGYDEIFQSLRLP